MVMRKQPRLVQYRLNVIHLLGMYENGMNDYGENLYPKMTFDQVVEYVNNEVYTFIDSGTGLTSYNDIAIKWARELKFVKKSDKLAIIRAVAEECGILKD